MEMYFTSILVLFGMEMPMININIMDIHNFGKYQVKDKYDGIYAIIFALVLSADKYRCKNRIS